ncbi:hypothetical protein [Streptomyces sp. PA5.6]|uniref:hypothetical protein n=1 Tax=Streptomyces sp. PA5.6 TaxID=3035651 RepID=UPI003904D944
MTYLLPDTVTCPCCEHVFHAAPAVTVREAKESRPLPLELSGPLARCRHRVLMGTSLGRTRPQIADDIGCTLGAVRADITVLLQAFAVDSPAALVLTVRRRGYLPPLPERDAEITGLARQVLHGIARGLTDTQIAAELQHSLNSI